MLILSAEVNDLTSKMNKIADTVISITGDKEFTKTLHTTVKNVNRLSSNVNCLLESEDTQALIADIRVTAKNVSEISGYVNDMTKDEELKAQINKSVTKLNTALDKLTITLDTVNYVTEDERDNIKQSLKEVEATTANVKTFSEKLNKRFLLFRLMF